MMKIYEPEFKMLIDCNIPFRIGEVKRFLMVSQNYSSNKNKATFSLIS